MRFIRRVLIGREGRGGAELGVSIRAGGERGAEIARRTRRDKARLESFPREGERELTIEGWGREREREEKKRDGVF